MTLILMNVLLQKKMQRLNFTPPKKATRTGKNIPNQTTIAFSVFEFAMMSNKEVEALM